MRSDTSPERDSFRLQNILVMILENIRKFAKKKIARKTFQERVTNPRVTRCIEVRQIRSVDTRHNTVALTVKWLIGVLAVGLINLQLIYTPRAFAADIFRLFCRGDSDTEPETTAAKSERKRRRGNHGGNGSYGSRETVRRTRIEMSSICCETERKNAFSRTVILFIFRGTLIVWIRIPAFFTHSEFAFDNDSVFVLSKKSVFIVVSGKNDTSRRAGIRRG